MKGEVAAFSVRAQRCQCHYISTTPRTVAVLHNQLKPGHRTMSGNKIATRVAFTMCNIRNPFCAIFFINLCYIHHSLCVIFIIYFMLYSSFILCYIHHIIFAIFIIPFCGIFIIHPTVCLSAGPTPLPVPQMVRSSASSFHFFILSFS